MTINDIVGHIDDPEERASAASALLREIRRRQQSAAESQLPRIRRTEKRCPRCDTVKPIDEFGVGTDRPDGRQGHCRVCRSKSTTQ